MTRNAHSPLSVTFKIASRCNLNCSYCYVYNKLDDSWRSQPARISDEVIDASIIALRRHCAKSGQHLLRIVFHGGEPLLVGHDSFDRWCRKLRTLDDIVEVRFALQTNGVLIDDEWAELFAAHKVVVGISIDGTPDVHDAQRVDHKGRGSYDGVLRGVEALRRNAVEFSLLSVISLASDPIATHRHLLSLGPAQIEYLFPDQTHDTIGALRALHGPTPAADFLIPIFEEWWGSGKEAVQVGPFIAIVRAILGGVCEVDFIGNNPLGYVFIEPDGAIEGLDVLRTCGPGLAQTGLNVRTHDFSDLEDHSEFHYKAIFEGLPLPSGCRNCRERSTCAGGYLPHRYASGDGFDHPSAWCADILRLFDHLRGRLGVPPNDTHLRREALASLSVDAEGVLS